MEKAGEKNLFAIYKKKGTEVNDTCVMRRIRRDARNHEGQFEYRRKNIFNEESFQRSYNELSITTIVKHSSIQNNTARQIFLDGEIFALLPIAKDKTSIVFSDKELKSIDLDIISKNSEQCVYSGVYFGILNEIQGVVGLYNQKIEFKKSFG